MSGERNRINNFHKWALLSVAFTVDFLQTFLIFIFFFIPLIGGVLASAVGLIARIVFWLWFRALHVGFADKFHRYVTNVTVTIVEALPYVNFIPGWTIGTYLLIRQVRKEDKKHNEEYRKKQQGNV